jgi:uncharacterized membrane protein YbaN (DUF454 family)
MEPVSTTKCPVSGAPASPRPDSVPRVILAATGVLCVGLGAVGVVVPGLPTTIFLIAACWCFARSCPWLEDRLVRTRLFRPFLRYLDGEAPMPLRARVVTIVVMWAAILVSGWALRSREVEWGWLAVLAVAGVVGGVFVWRLGRNAPGAEPAG